MQYTRSSCMAVKRFAHTPRHPIHLPEGGLNLRHIDHALANRHGRVEETLADAPTPIVFMFFNFVRTGMAVNL